MTPIWTDVGSFPDIAGVARVLLDLGALGVLIILVLAIAWGLFRGPKSKTGWVPGWMYVREQERADKAEATQKANVEALEQLTASVNRIVDTALKRRA